MTISFSRLTLVHGVIRIIYIIKYPVDIASLNTLKNPLRLMKVACGFPNRRPKRSSEENSHYLLN
jgi:hypothetical protein